MPEHRWSGLMSPSLRKLPAEGVYEVSGSIDGLSPGRRIVSDLTVRQLDGSSGEGLAPLAAFGDLRVLQLEQVAQLDLSLLARLPLERLTIHSGQAIDVTALSAFPALTAFFARDVREWVVPRVLRLPGSLRLLGLLNDGLGQTGTTIQQLIEAIDWRALTRLESLTLAVGGLEPLDPIRVDLGFLRSLSALKDIDIPQGVWHQGDGLSPLEPPFDGLSEALETVRIDAWDPAPAVDALRRRFGDRVTVYQRSWPAPADGTWALEGPGDGVEAWTTYGSLVLARGGHEGANEYEAAEAAARALQAADPLLRERVDFDPEGGGTGISAPTRADLERTLRLIGATAPPDSRGS